ncbi:cell wall hydrolase [Paracraurococcus lichenis]|uniref:Cell wall hydrolase n=1 Tax=Paracraurococcus lichenis TaxID=3064888 RepID=A0ABT9DXQ6_9PROT|nr:cell wall hydrolase [Paracraurococcus sp. LOR1-02]MDO9708685.1 cell wall hydrolase [Paracraurococcus sp. LOR1-02]
MTAAEILALTLRAEAGDRPVRAIEALAALVVNRARLAMGDAAARARFAPGAAAREPWPRLLAFACRAPFLFACWRPRHPRRAALLEAARQEDSPLAICRRVAARAMAGALPDPTGGATHWHAAETLPGWALGRVPLAEIGGLVFYRLEEAPEPAQATCQSVPGLPMMAAVATRAPSISQTESAPSVLRSRMSSRPLPS